MKIISLFWWLVAGVVIGLYLWSFKSAQLTWLIGGISTLRLRFAARGAILAPRLHSQPAGPGGKEAGLRLDQF